MIRSTVFLVAVLLSSVAMAQSAIVIDLGNNTAMVIAISADGQVTFVPSAPILRTTPGPTPNPDPTPAQNPYSTPPSSLKTVVEDIVDFPLSRRDATDIAEVFNKAAGRASSSTTKTGELRQYIIDTGKPLGLKDKYDGLSEAVDKVLDNLMGVGDREAKPTDVAALRAVAWAVWEAGK